MNLLLRVALLAYPRSFRRHYGTEWVRTIADMRTHSHHSAIRIGGTVVAEALTTAVHMRWENLMKPTRTALTVIAATITLAALVMGSEAIAVLAVAIVVLVGLQFAGKDRPITPTDPSVTRRWYLWMAGAAAAFLLGLGVLAIAEEEGGLSEVAWATWMLSWAAAAVLALIGTGLGATRLITNRLITNRH
jgi:hypothetical protein